MYTTAIRKDYHESFDATHCNAAVTQCNTYIYNIQALKNRLSWPIYYNTLQHSCNTAATQMYTTNRHWRRTCHDSFIATYCNTLQHSCNTAATQMYTTNRQHVMTLSLQHTATQQQRTATRIYTAGRRWRRAWYDSFNASLDCNTLQHTATHCNTLQHTATASMISLIQSMTP